jgi:hypothetical protein
MPDRCEHVMADRCDPFPSPRTQFPRWHSPWRAFAQVGYRSAATHSLRDRIPGHNRASSKSMQFCRTNFASSTPLEAMCWWSGRPFPATALTAWVCSHPLNLGSATGSFGRSSFERHGGRPPGSTQDVRPASRRDVRLARGEAHPDMSTVIGPTRRKTGNRQRCGRGSSHDDDRPPRLRRHR